MLNRVYVDNYRSFVNFQCRFSEKQLILGPNGSGKTTLFDVLALLRDFCISGIQFDYALVGSTRTRWQNVPAQTFELDITGNGGMYGFRLQIDSWGIPERPRVLKEEVFYSGEPIFRFLKGEVHLYNDKYEEKVKYPFDWHRSALATITERTENTKLSWFKRWFGNLLFISPDPRQMNPLAEKEAAAPTRNLSNFASWYRHLRLESNDQEFLEDLREVIPGFESLDLKESGGGTRFLTVTFSSQSGPGNSNQTFSHGFHELSDGQRILIGLYSALHYALKPGVTLFFDEPDNFVSLREIQPWLDKVLDSVEDADANKQVFFISHHPELLDRLALQGGIHLDRPENLHTRVRQFPDTLQTGLSPSELISRGWENE